MKKIEEIRDLFLLSGEFLDELVYDVFLSGELSADELKRIYRMLSDWQKLGEEILGSIRGH